MVFKVSKYKLNEEFVNSMDTIPLSKLEEIVSELISSDKLEKIIVQDEPKAKDIDYVKYAMEVLKALYDNSELDYVFIEDELYDRCVTFLNSHDIYIYDSVAINSRLLNDTPHKYPELKGTIDKAKYVYKAEVDKDDNNVYTVEEFFEDVISKLGLKKSHKFNISVSFKNDGQSIIGDISKKGKFKQALTRGKNGLGADVTHIVKEIEFGMREYFRDKSNGVKFEVMLSKSNLVKYNELKGENYKNTRSAINSIFNNPEYAYLLTLVPLDYLSDEPRMLRVYNMNDKFINDIDYFYEIFSADYKTLLKLIEAMKDATYEMRPTLNFDIDGLVIEILDEDIRESLGRKNDVNQYEIALKFPSEIRETRLVDIKFEVGYTGNITPVAMYVPVRFSNNSTHKKSTLSSYGKFKEYKFRKGDVIEVKYVNDVICQVFKDHTNPNNMNNENDLITFPDTCPDCGNSLEFTDRGAYCVNRYCDKAIVGRMVNFTRILGLVDMSEKTFEALYNSNIVMDIRDIFELENREADIIKLDKFGDIKFSNMINEVNKMRSKEYFDYMIMAAMGLGSIKRTLFKSICKEYNIIEALLDNSVSDNEILANLIKIDGIGENRAKEILEFRNIESDILRYVVSRMKIKYTTNSSSDGKVIRMTGCRLDKSIQEDLINKGHDVSDGSVTKKTDILLVPSAEFKSTKVDKARSYGVTIIPIDDFSVDNI